MSSQAPLKWAAVLALILLVATIWAVVAGVGRLGTGRELPAIDAAPTSATRSAGSEPTATEPILPPAPTAAQSATGSPESATATADGSLASPAVAAGTRVEQTPVPAAAAATVVPDAIPAEPATLATVEPPPLHTASPAVSVTPLAPTQAATVAPELPTAPIRATEGASNNEPYGRRWRLGVGASGTRVTGELAEKLGFGWYVDWWAGLDRFVSAEVEYMPMIRLKEGGPQPNGEELLKVIDAHPGAVWLIGNEPDVKWQDNATPDAYAQAYHDLYALLKAHDPTSLVAIGGITQPTPLRLRYLDLILEAYQSRYGEPMPVDVWNVHNFILREERDSWGVDIPPGMDDQTGILREIADHDSLEIFEQQIVDFRRWMKERGQQQKPLIVTEYGILMPHDYGFSPEQVERFMLGTFEYFRTAADPALGYPEDGNRLVQRWAWYSLADTQYPTGNLLQRTTSELTRLGEAFREYAHAPR